MVFIWFTFAFGYCGDFDVWLLIVYIVCLLCLIACLFRFWFGLGPVFELFGCLGVVLLGLGLGFLGLVWELAGVWLLVTVRRLLVWWFWFVCWFWMVCVDCC